MPAAEQRPMLSATEAAAGSVALFAEAAVFDLCTPAAFEPGLFYLPAVGLLAWSRGAAAGIALAIPSAALRLWGTAAPLTITTGWLICTWLLVYVAVALLVARWQRARQRQFHLARTDPLTGLANRPALLERIEAELNRGRRGGIPLSVVYLDCDDFKQINDQLGHAAGDRVLQTVAAALQHSIRNYDLAARPGGDEFVVVLPETSAEAARAAVGRIQAKLADAIDEQGCRLTFSIGTATIAAASTSAENALRAADELMYAVKQSGKNGARLAVVEIEPTPPRPSPSKSL